MVAEAEPGRRAASKAPTGRSSSPSPSAT